MKYAIAHQTLSFSPWCGSTRTLRQWLDSCKPETVKKHTDNQVDSKWIWLAKWTPTSCLEQSTAVKVVAHAHTKCELIPGKKPTCKPTNMQRTLTLCMHYLYTNSMAEIHTLNKIPHQYTVPANAISSATSCNWYNLYSSLLCSTPQLPFAIYISSTYLFDY